MSWRKKLSENIADILKFLGWAFVILDGVVLAAFSLWFVCRFLWQFTNWLQRVLFSNPW